jgi:hypothetical protein
VDAVEMALGTYVAVAFGRCLGDLSSRERRRAVIDLLDDLEVKLGRGRLGDHGGAARSGSTPRPRESRSRTVPARPSRMSQ